MYDLTSLRAEFAAAFDGAKATRLARAPGRVNLIGEHIDYFRLPVFPMAIQLAVHVLFRPRNDGLMQAANANGFERREFLVAGDPPPYPLGDWGNYLKAA